MLTRIAKVVETGASDLVDYRSRIADWLTSLSKKIGHATNGPNRNSKFLDLAPTDAADEEGVYSDALFEVIDNPSVFNIALTGPYGSGKSSIIKSFLKKYNGTSLQISLAAFWPEDSAASVKVSKQEIERSILQQMLYGADANKLPFSRFKRIQAPRKWSSWITSLYIVLAFFSCWHLFQKREAVASGAYFLPFALSNWFNLSAFALGGTLLWLAAHRCYIASFGVSLKSVSLKDIEIATAAVSQESILNRHLDEIIYFFQSTRYDLVIIEDLDRFDDPDIFVTLREINKIINDNSGVNRTVRFLYALRDDMFTNTDRTKFFEFIVPVIPIINSSNSIDMVIEQGERLALDDRLDRQFLREVSRYLSDLRLIRNIFNEYAIYVANLEADDENTLDTNKLLAVLIYKNIFPRDFELLHANKGNLAEILGQHDAFVANGEIYYKAEISRHEQEIEQSERQLPANLLELRNIYAMALIKKLPVMTAYIATANGNIPLREIADHEEFEEIVASSRIICLVNGSRQNIDVDGFQDTVSSAQGYNERKVAIERKTANYRNSVAQTISDLRGEISSLRVVKFNELIRKNVAEAEPLFAAFGDNAELARYLIFEGYLDDSYYQYTSLFHSGRLSPSDNKFLRQIRGFGNPEPDFQIDNPKEVVAAMREEDFGQSYVLNVKIVDCLLSEPQLFKSQVTKMSEFVASHFSQCEEFFSAYYATGIKVGDLLSTLVTSWAGFVPAIIDSARAHEHIARILAHLSDTDLGTISRKYPHLSEFASSNLTQVLALKIDFEPARLKVLKIEASDLSSLEEYPAIARLLFEEGLYRISVGNIDFIFRVMLSTMDPEALTKQNYTFVLSEKNDALNSKIELDFDSYLQNVLLALPENSEESVSAILSVINRDELAVDDIRTFLATQTAVIPSLDEVSGRLHAMLFELRKIKPSWESCLQFLTSETYEPDTLTAFLDDEDTRTTLCHSPIPDTQAAYPLRKFLIENEALSDQQYRMYVRALPRPFKNLPEGLGASKQEILIEELKLTFSSTNFAALNQDDGDSLQVLFVAKNMDTYLQTTSDFALDDDFREQLLGTDMEDSHKLEIIKSMDLPLVATMPARSGKIGPVLVQADSDASIVPPDTALAIIVNSRPIGVQIKLFNTFQEQLDDQQVRTILDALPEPYSQIKPGYGTPRIENSEPNLEFVRWLEERRFISSSSIGGWWGVDDDIRINLRRK